MIRHYTHKYKEWWSTAHSSLVTHRRLKWVWIFPGIPVAFWLRESVPFLVFMSVYAIIIGHWSAEEAAKTEVKQEEQENSGL
jgi:hypothetical protein